jgi:hypothetical protein
VHLHGGYSGESCTYHSSDKIRIHMHEEKSSQLSLIPHDSWSQWCKKPGKQDLTCPTE